MIALCFLLMKKSNSFMIPSGLKLFGSRQIQIQMAGMGMASNSSKKKKSGSSKKKKKTGASSGSSFDVAKSTLKSEKLYDELLKDAGKLSDEDHADHGKFFTSEYVIAARLSPNENKDSIPGAASISDWVPVAQLCLTRSVEGNNDDDSSHEKIRLSNAISSYCREISYLATLGSSLFKSIPRNLIQYSAEDVDSFYKYVYEDVIEGKNSDEKNDNVMTKAQARQVLQLDEGCNDLSDIKQAYRKMSMKLHPDRFAGIERTKEEEDRTNNAFTMVKIAYESLNSGVRDNSGDGKVRSWYESLGGRARTDFNVISDLVSVETAKKELSNKNHKCAVAGINPETVLAFVTRNQVAA